MKKVVYLLLCFTAVAQSQIIRKYSNEFMNIGVDASSLAMSNAVVASTNDVNSVYWNPAGLMNIEGEQAALMHASYFANIAQYDYVAYAKNIDEKSAYGLAAIRFGVDNILNTTQLIDNQGNIDYNRISLFSAADYGFIFSYARKLQVPGFQYGINAKVVRRIIGDFASSWGFGFDFGLQFKKNEWDFGIMLRDITTTYNIWNINKDEFAKIQNSIISQNQTLPENSEITLPTAQLGMSKKFEFHNESALLACTNLNLRFSQTNDIISTKGLSVDPAIGFEYSYIDMVFVRTGVGNFQKIKQIDSTKSVGFQPNIGLGFKYKGIQIDYALTDLGDQSAALYSNIFSLKIDLEIFRK